MKTVSIVIINYRTAELTIGSLASLVSDMEGRDDRCAIVIDNNSGDGSDAVIEAAIAENGWDAWARLVRSPVNGGFSAGNNFGMAAQDSKFYLLLNSDARVLAGAIDTLLDTMESDPKVGLAGPSLQWEIGDPQDSCFRYLSPMSEFLAAAGTGPLDWLFSGFVVSRGQFDDITETDWVSFACVLIRGETRKRIGDMDEGYFLYYDDVDYCRMARRAGWKVVHVPQGRAIHLRGGTASLKSDAKALRRLPKYNYESRTWYYAKFYGGVAGVILANTFWIMGRCIAWLRETLGGREPHTCEREFADNWTNWNAPFRTSSYLTESARQLSGGRTSSSSAP